MGPVSRWPSSPGPDAPVRLRSSLHCPYCGKEEELTMPENACVIMRPCSGCGRMMRAQPGDCCVFCSYGSLPCPPVQQHRRCGNEPEDGPRG